MCSETRSFAGSVSASRPQRRENSHRAEDDFLTGSRRFRSHREMSEPPHITSKKSIERAAREARLAKALRDNLVRRKEQKRARDRRAVPRSEETDREREPPA